MKNSLLMAAALAALLSAFPAAAGPTSETLLAGLRKLESKNPIENSSFDAGLAMGYVSGVANLNGTAGASCNDSSVSALQLAAVVRKYLEDHPEVWNQPADIEISRAVVNSFPCRRKAGR